MSIERRGDERLLSCDDCGETYGPFPRQDFAERVAAAKEEGWTVKLVNGDWQHLCSDCEPSTPGAKLAQARKMFGGQ